MYRTVKCIALYAHFLTGSRKAGIANSDDDFVTIITAADKPISRMKSISHMPFALDVDLKVSLSFIAIPARLSMPFLDRLSDCNSIDLVCAAA